MDEDGGATRLEAELRAFFRSQGSALVALSGGVDSSVLAAIAALELGPYEQSRSSSGGSGALAVTGVSPSLSDEELAEIRAFCVARGLAHEIVETDEMHDPDYVKNAPDRCYHCKSELFSRLAGLAAARGVAVVVEGTHADDLKGHRPGRRAATEAGVRSPLVELGATKEQVRALARRLGLQNAERPSSPCLSSRIAYGVEVTSERLDRVRRGELLLRGLGFADCRVRLHVVDDGQGGRGEIARVEVKKRDLPRAVEHAERIARELKRLGFTWATLDLLGLRSGSLLEVFPTERAS